MRLAAAAAVVLSLLASESRAAIANPPHEDIYFLVEHLPEAADEALHFSLPWPDTSREPGGWRPIVVLGGVDVGADFARARGGFLILGASHARSSTWALELFGVHGRFDVSGGSGENVLRALAVNGVPLDLPERASFSEPRGLFRTSGLGMAVARSSRGARRWTLLGGLLLERLELKRYRLDYRLLGGADSGATGVLDKSGTNDFVTPHVGAQVTLPLGRRWDALPRFQLGMHLPPGEFDTRLTGPGFDRSTDSTGAQSSEIGDAFFALGAGLRDRVTGLEIDLGVTATFPAIQHLMHRGIDRGWLLALTWQGR